MVSRNGNSVATKKVNNTSKKKLRLIKVLVQPIFVIDDGSSLEEAAIEPVTIPEKQWNEFVDTGFSALIKKAQESVETIE